MVCFWTAPSGTDWPGVSERRQPWSQGDDAIAPPACKKKTTPTPESDYGVGQAQPSIATTYCQGNTAALGLTAASSGSTWMEDFYSTVWGNVDTDGDLPDTWVPAQIDNGQAVSWALQPGAASQSRSWVSVLLGGPTAAEVGGAPNPSVPPTTCDTPLPVNCATGDFWHAFTDVAIPTRGLPLTFERTYDLVNSQLNGRLGHGWHDSLDLRITRTGDTATFTQENGSTVTFDRQADGSWATPAHVLASLSCTPAGDCTVTRAETGLQYTFTASGVLSAVRTPAGETLTLSYGADGHLTAIDHGGAGRLTFDWTGDRITRVTDPAGRSTTYSYDANGDLTATTAPGGGRWGFAYDGAHHLVTMTDPLGNTTVNTFDTSFRVTSQKQPDGGTLTLQYDGDPATAAGGTTTTVDARGVRTTYSFANMLLTSRSVAAGQFSDNAAYTYDVVTLRLVAVDQDGVRHESRYDGLGRQVASIDAAGNLTAYTYDGSSYRQTSSTSPMGATSSATYDARGRMVTATSPDGVVTTLTYGDPAHPSDVTSSVTAGRTTTYAHDPLGDVTTSTISDGTHMVVLSAAAYDDTGTPYCTVSPTQYSAGVRCPAPGHSAPGSTTTTFEAAGRVATRTDPTGGVIHYDYDAAGNLTTVTDAIGRVTTIAYDADGRPTKATRGAGTAKASTVTTAYDIPAGTGGCPATGETAYCRSTNDGTRTTVEGFNANGDLALFGRPSGGTRTYLHTGSRLVEQRLEDREVTSYGYTGDLLSSVSYSDGSTAGVNFGYDTDGNRVTTTDGTGQTNYEYDAAGRLTAVTTPNGTVRGAYAADGLLKTIVYPAGEQVQREYDVAGRLVAVQDWSGRRTSFTLDDNGARYPQPCPTGAPSPPPTTSAATSPPDR